MSDMTKEQRARILQNMGLTMAATFVPFSQSRNRAEESPSLNWRVTISRDGREVLTTDYSAGCAHAPSYRQVWGRKSVEDQERDLKVAWECEHGYPAIGVHWRGRTGAEVYGGTQNKAKAILPDIVDVMASLAMDSDVLDAGGFEQWARDLGYDPDSRAAEKTYQACLEIALKLRAALGDTGLADLRRIFEGY